MKRWGLAAAAATLLLGSTAGCSNESSDDSGSQTDDSVSRYEQTWPQNYSDTTCTEWLQEMSPAQQFAAAADMLTGARNKGDGGTGLPPDSLIDEFEQGIGTACVIPTENIASIAAALYLTERSTFSP